MNGFANGVLSFLLSWIRALIRNIWRMVGTENGGTAYQFLAANWKMLLLFLLAGGLVTDRIIYFFRWRPDYIWHSRRARRKTLRRARKQRHFPDSEPPQEIVYEPPISVSPDCSDAPVLNGAFVADSDLYWDEAMPLTDWERPENPGTYGAPQPEPVYHSEFLAYAPPPQEPPVQPVHPGLDEEAFRQRFGLAESIVPKPMHYAPAFRPFTSVQSEESKAQSRLTRIARRARTLVSMDAEEGQSIRDLQNTVDVSKAFHEPVYPQPLKCDDN